MSIRIAISTTPTPRRAQHKAQKIIGIAGLLAAVLTANVVDAATSRHHRASMPKGGWVAHYAPYDRGISAPSQVKPIIWDGYL
jgi:hypothetical protein